MECTDHMQISVLLVLICVRILLFDLLAHLCGVHNLLITVVKILNRPIITRSLVFPS